MAKSVQLRSKMYGVTKKGPVVSMRSRRDTYVLDDGFGMTRKRERQVDSLDKERDRNVK